MIAAGAGQTPRRRSLLKAIDPTSVVVVAAFAVAAMALLVFIDRGFDVTDEGLYLVSARHPADVWASTTDYYFYLGALYRVAGSTVVGLRVFGMLILLATVGVAAAGAWTALPVLGVPEPRMLSRIGLAAFMADAALLYYAWGTPSPGYNLLTSAATYLAMGLLLLGLAWEATEPQRWQRSLIAFFGVGAAAGIAFFVKFPAGVALLAVATTALLVWPLADTRARTRAFAVILLGFGTWVAFHFGVVSPPLDWWRRLRIGLELTQLSERNYAPREALLGYAHRGYDVLRWQIIAELWPALLLVLPATLASMMYARRRSGSRTRGIMLAVCVLAFVFVLARIVGLGWELGGRVSSQTLFAPFLALTMIAGLMLLASVAVRDHEASGLQVVSWRLPLVVLLLAVALTFGPAVGTGNAIDANAMLTMPPLFFGVYIVVELATRWGQPRWLGRGLLVSTAVIAASQTATAAIRSPYRLNTGILEQTQRVALGGRNDYVLVDTATAEFFSRASAALAACGHRPEGDLIVLVGMPGLDYALAGRSPASAWYYSWGRGAKRYNERLLSLIAPERIRHAYLIVTPAHSSSLPDLGKFGVDLSRDHQLCGELTWPVTNEPVQLWRPGTAS